MSNAMKISTVTHYGLSTAAAVLYAIGWLLASRVQAEVSTDQPMLQAVVVTAQREVPVAKLAPVVVVASREVSYATLSPVVVSASRDVYTANAPTLQPAVYTSAKPLVSVASADVGKKKGVVARMRTWLAAALIK